MGLRHSPGALVGPEPRPPVRSTSARLNAGIGPAAPTAASGGQDDPVKELCDIVGQQVHHQVAPSVAVVVLDLMDLAPAVEDRFAGVVGDGGPHLRGSTGAQLLGV